MAAINPNGPLNGQGVPVGAPVVIHPPPLVNPLPFNNHPQGVAAAVQYLANVDDHILLNEHVANEHLFAEIGPMNANRTIAQAARIEFAVTNQMEAVSEGIKATNAECSAIVGRTRLPEIVAIGDELASGCPLRRQRALAKAAQVIADKAKLKHFGAKIRRQQGECIALNNMKVRFFHLRQRCKFGLSPRSVCVLLVSLSASLDACFMTLRSWCLFRFIHLREG